MALEQVHIRAMIYLGDLVVETPYILSFNVKKERNQKSTFSASLKILYTDLDNMGTNEVVILAGIENRLKRIFTGYTLQSNPSPCWDDPKYVILNISGADVLYRLEQEKYTRLQETSRSKWAAITGVTRKAQKGSQFKLIHHELLKPTDGDFTTDDEKYASYKQSDLDGLAQPVANEGSRTVQLQFGLVTDQEEGE